MTSPQMIPETIATWATKKGVHIIATGDWTHPEWLEMLRDQLEPAEDGLFVLRGQDSNEDAPRFILSTEIACVHPGSTGSRIRHVVMVPTFDDAATIATQLGWIGNLRADGRPILKMHSEELARIVFTTTGRALLFPAHVWVPQLSVLGMGGFDRIEQCYGEMASHIVAFETGLSSDPAMNGRCSFLDRYAQLSNSDAHSPNTIGREATVLAVQDRSFSSIAQAIDHGAIVETVEFFPEEGRYHAIGHARCDIVMTPQEAEDVGGQCPSCGGTLTIGVEGRIAALADRSKQYHKDNAPPFRRMLGLDVIIAQAFGIGIDTKTVIAEYEKLLRNLGDEYSILRDATPEDIAEASTQQIGSAVQRVRDGGIAITPGYDGEFGTIEIFSEEERIDLAPQQSLF